MIAAPDTGTPPFVGVSKPVRDLLAVTDRVAGSECNILIEGESGTGKEVIARRLHAASPRSEGPFVPVNCASVSSSLFESQFFGHVRGAFTGAEQSMDGLVRSAGGGTLFLDEVGEIPMERQAKLLRALQDGEVRPVGSDKAVRIDARFIAATNRNLKDAVRDGSFRKDLFYRLNVVRLWIPPLRRRPEDVEVLLDHFASACARQYDVSVASIPKAVRARLAEYPWPGNVRELANWVERLHATGLPPEALAESLFQEADDCAPPAASDEAGEETVVSLEDAERWAIRKAMDRAGGRVGKAAELLRVHRSTLSRKLQELSAV